MGNTTYTIREAKKALSFLRRLRLKKIMTA